MNWPAEIADLLVASGVTALLIHLGDPSLVYINAGAVVVAGLTVIVLFQRLRQARSRYFLLAAATVALLLWSALHGGAGTLLLCAGGWSLFAARRLFSIGRTIDDGPQLKYLTIDLMLMAVTLALNLGAGRIAALAAAWFVIATWMRLLAFRFKEIGYAKSRGLVNVPAVGGVATGVLATFATILFTLLYLHKWLIEILIAIVRPVAAILLSGLFAFLQTLTNRKKRPSPPPNPGNQRLHDAVSRAHRLATAPHWLIMTLDIGLIAVIAAVIVVLYRRLKNSLPEQPSDIQVPLITRTRIKRTEARMAEPSSPLRKLFADWRRYGLSDTSSSYKSGDTARECLTAFQNSAKLHASDNAASRSAAAEQLIARYELERYGELPATKEETDSLRNTLRQSGIIVHPTKK